MSRTIYQTVEVSLSDFDDEDIVEESRRRTLRLSKTAASIALADAERVAEEIDRGDLAEARFILGQLIEYLRRAT